MKTSNPYDPHRVDISLFYGRNQLLSDLKSDVTAGRSCAVVGGRRIGKSTVLRKLEQILTQALTTNLHDGLMIIPIYLDLLSIPIAESSRPIYAAILSSMFACLTGLRLLNPRYGADMTRLAQFPGEESRVFKEILVGWLEILPPTCLVRFAVLFDEVEPIARSSWGNGFFSNWRSLLNNTPELYRNVCAVFAGAKEMNALCEDVGSPLANVLVWRALTLFDWTDTYRLIQEPTGRRVRDHLVRKLFVLTGGHPFLVQFLMQRICEHDGSCTQQVVDDATGAFLSSHTHVFSNWVSHFDHADRSAYVFLASKLRPQAKRELIQLVGDVAATNALSVLCHTGVASKRVSRTEVYRVQGTLFRDWFMRDLKEGAVNTAGEIEDVPNTTLAVQQSVTIKEFYMSGSSKYNVHNNRSVIGVGDNVRVEKFTMTYRNGIEEQIEVDALVKSLAILREEAAKRAATGEEYEAIDHIAQAEASAKKGDSVTLVTHLKSAGVWVAGIAKELGASIAAKIIEGQLGLN
jgi:hypothetical protein